LDIDGRDPGSPLDLLLQGFFLLLVQFIYLSHDLPIHIFIVDILHPLILFQVQRNGVFCQDDHDDPFELASPYEGFQEVLLLQDYCIQIHINVSQSSLFIQIRLHLHKLFDLSVH